MSKRMEYKQFPAVVTGLDEDKGIADIIFSVFGVLDEGHDIVHPGAFTKTVTERGRKVRVVDMHQTDSVLRVLGKPLAFKELRRNELPPEVLEQWPEATGGEQAEVQFNLQTQAGHDAFQHVKASDVDEWSFGYDAINPDFSKMTKDGEDISARNLREVKLYELSPVLWGMNPATMTTGVKADDEKRTMRSESDGKHPSSHYLVIEDPEKPSTWHLRVRDVNGDPDHRLMGAAWAALHEGSRGNRYEGPDKEAAIAKLRRLYAREGMDLPGKAADGPSEGKPYAIFKVGAEDKPYCVYKHDEDGNRTGEALGCHATEPEAQAQLAALYAGEGASAPPPPESKEERTRRVLAELAEILQDAGLETPTPEKGDNREHDDKAGPDGDEPEPPTSDVALEIEVYETLLNL